MAARETRKKKAARRRKSTQESELTISPLSTQSMTEALFDRFEQAAYRPRYKKLRRKVLPCCVVSLVAQPNDVPNAVVSILRRPGQPPVRTFTSGQKRMNFTVQVGRQADVPKINVIQYLTNVSLTHNGQNVQPDFGPGNKPWTWQPGADGYRVDQAEDIRCWPEQAGNNNGQNPGQNQGYGLQRDANTRTVSWFDDPGLDLNKLRRLSNAGRINAGDFPMVLSAEFKTDILCSDVNPCRRESAAARAALEQVWANSVVARVTWKIQMTVVAINVGPVLVFASLANNKPKIINVRRQILVPCEQGQ